MNSRKPITIKTKSATVTLTVDLKGYRTPLEADLPHTSASSERPSHHSNLPRTSAFFEHPEHHSDLYGFTFTFTPHAANISGQDLVFGNHFSHPIRQSLPYVFPLLLQALKWIDPSIQGDVYSDEPWLYGPALASMTAVSTNPSRAGAVVQEDNGLGLDASERRKYFLDEGHRQEWAFKEGKTYGFGFSGPWLDFNLFAVHLPGWGGFGLLRYWDGQPVRFLLKNRTTGEVYLAIEFQPLLVGKAAESGDAQKERAEGEARADADADID